MAANLITCPDCKGVGAPWNNSASVPCKRCKGTGRIKVPDEGVNQVRHDPAKGWPNEEHGNGR